MGAKLTRRAGKRRAILDVADAKLDFFVLRAGGCGGTGDRRLLADGGRSGVVK